MADALLTLSPDERAEILEGLVPTLGLPAIVLEKDVWLCWVLAQLFEMPNALPMAFKGGTSLSKVFNVIHRFSEDIDITIDYRAFKLDVDPLDRKLSKTAVKKLGEQLRNQLRTYSHEVVAPRFREVADATYGEGQLQVIVDHSGEQVRIHYPTRLQSTNRYLGNSVLLEFGARNLTEPNATHEVAPYVAAPLKKAGLIIPIAKPVVLAAERTFWEKATLVHVECNRPELKADPDRISRHWYDLAMLGGHVIGNTALADRVLLASVVEHKTAFYNTGYANYPACLAGKLRLVPDAPLLAHLEADFAKMVGAGMFFDQPQAPSFAAVLKVARELERRANQLSG